MLCRDIVRHILPKPLQDEIHETIGAASVLVGDGLVQPLELESFAGALGKGTIDYTPHQRAIDGIQEAMHSRRLCTIRYRSALGAEAKSYIVAPLRILVFHEALYFRCIVCDKSGHPQEDTCRTFAIQRIVTFELLNQGFSEITEPVDAGAFGFPFHDPIRVRVAFTPTVATYVSERQWSKDQWIRKRKNSGITLTFTSTSRQEVLSWVLSFGKEAELLEPKDLRREMQAMVNETARAYEST
jgi:predicted DNA-binding transcriptional regulator YafY